MEVDLRIVATCHVRDSRLEVQRSNCTVDAMGVEDEVV